ncbi:glycosyl hydrolase, partial [Niameybacter massiliensis]
MRKVSGKGYKVRMALGLSVVLGANTMLPNLSMASHPYDVPVSIQQEVQSTTSGNIVIQPGNEEQIPKYITTTSALTITNEVSVKLGKVVEANGIDANPADNHEALQIVTHDGKEGWRTNEKENMLFVYCGVSDDFIFDGTNAVEIEVEYFDEGTAEFALQYDSTGEVEKVAGFVKLTDTKQWKTHTFTIGDAKFANRFFGKDFRIGVWAPGIGTREDVTFGSIKVRKVDLSERQQVDVIFGNIPKFNGIYANPGDNQDAIQTVNYGGKEGWKTDEKANTLFIYCDVEDGFIYDGENTVELTVEYFDEGTAEFGVQYDSVYETEKVAGIVKLTDTKEWKTHTFILGDAKFANRFFERDIRIGVWAPGIGTREDVAFGSVTVKKLPPIKPISVQVKSPYTGNIFSEGDVVELGIQLENLLSDEKRDVRVTYTIENDVRNDQIATGEFSLTLQPNEKQTIPVLVNQLDAFGVYKMYLNVDPELTDEMIEKTIDFSYIPKVETALKERINDFFGVCTHFGLDRGVIPENLDVAQKMGAQFIRDEMFWDRAETEKGVVKILPHWDEYVDEAIARGMEPLIILDYGNPFYDGGGAPYTEEGLNAFANYARTIAEHFKGRVKYFEVWNEYNGTFNPTKRPPEDYAKLLKLTYATLKEVDPNCTVVGGVTAGTDLYWIERILRVGAIDDMDAISIHPYCYPMTPDVGKFENNIEQTFNLLKKYGKEKPVWITELGWPTQRDQYGVSEVDAGSYLVRSYVKSIASGMVDKYFWYDLQNDGTDIYNNEDNFGLVRGEGATVPLSAKADYVAYAQMVDALEAARFINDSMIDNKIRVNYFKRSTGEDVVVVWSTKDQGEAIAFETTQSSVTVMDLFGNERVIPALGGKVSISISKEPIYIVGEVGEVVTDDVAFKLLETFKEITKGECLNIEIKRGKNLEGITGYYSFALPEGWEVIGDTQFSKEGPIDTLKIQVPHTSKIGKYVFNIQPHVEKQSFDAVTLEVDVQNALQVSVLPMVSEVGKWDEWSVQIQLENKSKTLTLDGNIVLEKPQALAGTFNFEGIQPQTKQSIPISVPKDLQDDLIELQGKVQLENGETIGINQKISFLAAIQSKNVPIIDGKITEMEWNDSMPFYLNKAEQVQENNNWQGIEDLSGVGYVKWDEKHFYLSMEVTDDTHSQEDFGGGIWKGDSIQFSLDTHRLNRPSPEGHHQFGFGFDGETITKWRWAADNGHNPGEVLDAKCQIVREGNKTNYEIAIPWNQILPKGETISEKTCLGFSLLINENDGEGRTGWIEYRQGIGFGPDPNGFGDIILLKIPDP